MPPAIPFAIDDSAAYGAAANAIDRAAFAARLEAGRGALERLRARRDDGSLPLLRLPGRRDDLPELAELAQRMRRRTTDVLVLGTGGSSLGGQTLYALADQGFGPPAGSPRIHFLDNIDPATFAALTAAVDFRRVRILAISKSGGTAETLMQLLTLLPHLEKAVGPEGVAERLVAVTEAADNPLRRLATRLGATVLEHDPKVGGRYSVLSLVGLLPTLIAGLDAAKVRAGAAAVLDAALAAEPADCAPLAGAALNVAHAEAGRPITVLMPYVDRLAHFGLWFRQLWAESLGKDGHGTTPVRAMGTVDQHSQLQLYLAGPADKLFTVIVARAAGKGDRVPAALARDEALGYLKGRRMGDLLDAEQRATAQTLARNGRPVRVFALDRVDERTLGGLFMHFMLETILAADLLGVDAFDQPAVEEGKVLAREYLGAA
ncbi:MAG: glucose-6-phosphate isomerase [Alphaproteobacteria bacterium]